MAEMQATKEREPEHVRQRSAENYPQDVEIQAALQGAAGGGGEEEGEGAGEEWEEEDREDGKEDHGNEMALVAGFGGAGGGGQEEARRRGRRGEEREEDEYAGEDGGPQEELEGARGGRARAGGTREACWPERLPSSSSSGAAQTCPTWSGRQALPAMARRVS